MKPSSLLAFAVCGAIAVAATPTVVRHLDESKPSARGPQAPARVELAASGAVKHLDTSAAEHRRVRAYWTADRMRAALPGELLVRSTPSVGKPTPPDPGNGMVGEYYDGAGSVVATTGKVFFTMGGLNYVCSGSSVASANESLVVTAGHCVHEGPGAYATNFVFVPGYDDGVAPYGTFSATALVTTPQWAAEGDLAHDLGFAVTTSGSGVTLTATVGGQAIAFNQPPGQVMHAFGYPAESPYDGSDIAWCWGTAIQDKYRRSGQGIECNLTGGSSGGPWLLGFDAVTGVGTLNSVTSFVYRGGKLRGYVFGSYFGPSEQAAYEVAQNL